MRLAWTESALGDLRALRVYIAEHDPKAAGKVALAILDGVERLTEFPASGRPGRLPNTRELVIPGSRYLVVYRVKDETLEILRVLHSARRWP
jgi:toxin ParE1/3/4